MKEAMRAIEVTGNVDEQGELHLDELVTAVGPGRVRVILLVPDEEDLDERDWLRAAASSPAFDFLGEPEEDIYSLEDAKPFHDQAT